MPEVTYSGASRLYPGSPPVRAVDALDLSIPDGELLVLVGPSGSGKSTALRMLAGLEDVDEGTIHIGDRDVTHLPPKDRAIAMVFQNYALYPHMSVAENMGFALTVARRPKEEIARRVARAAELLDLTRYLERKPKALSGGQRQRVAMGRAIVREPSVFLMDEPLSNLDAKLRVETRANITELQRRLATTTVYVTHDQVEAMTMGSRVAVLRDGRLQQCAPPRELYDRPTNSFVAGFIGSPAMNLWPGKLGPEGIVVGGFTLLADRKTVSAAWAGGTTDVLVGLRAEHLRPARPDEAALDVHIDLREELGSDTFVYGRLDDGHRVVVRPAGGTDAQVGSTLRIAPTGPEHVHLFDAAHGGRLSV
ncbi:ABC transporter ATP-binding protein [Rhodococcus koreensis]|uniref:ABC transporter ATP-binding protein n=1 Tax=Rhodococcus koreensis TaxID=99653 RepID=UPI00366DB9EE